MQNQDIMKLLASLGGAISLIDIILGFDDIRLIVHDNFVSTYNHFGSHHLIKYNYT